MTSDVSPFTAALARKNSRLGQAQRIEGVKRSHEFNRIASLPRRSLIDSIDVDGLSALLRLPDGDPNKCKGCEYCDHGNMTLFADQAYAIKEMHDVGGVFVGADVSAGKSLMIILGMVVMRAQRPLVLMPAAAIPGFEDQLVIVRRHFRTLANVMIASYESVSSPNGKDFFTARMPDVIYCDESHHLKDEDVSRGRRFGRYLDAFPDTRLCCFTGTPLDRTIKACAHLLYFCLKSMCPIPYFRQNGRNALEDELATWALAIDANVRDEDRFSAGALLEFESWIAPNVRARIGTNDNVELAQACFCARLIATPGVIFSSTDVSTIPIHIREHPVDVPANVQDAFELLRSPAAQTPAGQSYGDAVELYRIVRQLGQGFYYRWVWPKDPVTGNEIRDLVWIQNRQNWQRKIRNVISYSRGSYDSASEVTDACERHEQYVLAREYGQKDVLAKLRDLNRIDSQEYRNWRAVEKNYTPVVATEWIDKFLVYRVAEWLERAPGIAWVESQAMGQEIRKQGFMYYAGGNNEIRHETVSCAAAIKAHSFGKNLQQFSRNLVVTPPTRGTIWQQLIGRTDRVRQTAPHIEVDLFLHVREFWTSFYKARQDSKLAASPGITQKLTRASIGLLMTDAEYAIRTMGTDPLWKYSEKAA